jgi:uncharacterized membrane protein
MSYIGKAQRLFNGPKDTAKHGEPAMVRKEYRIVLAAIAVFVALGGVGLVIHGLLFDRNVSFRYGMAAVVIGVAGFVMLLNPTPKDDA